MRWRRSTVWWRSAGDMPAVGSSEHQDARLRGQRDRELELLLVAVREVARLDQALCRRGRCGQPMKRLLDHARSGRQEYQDREEEPSLFWRGLDGDNEISRSR